MVRHTDVGRRENILTKNKSYNRNDNWSLSLKYQYPLYECKNYANDFPIIAAL